MDILNFAERLVGSPMFAIVAFCQLVVSVGRCLIEAPNRSRTVGISVALMMLAAHGFMSGSLWPLLGSIVFVVGGSYGLRRVGLVVSDGVPTVQAVAARSASDGLGAVVAWLGTATVGLPDHAAVLADRIVGQVRELDGIRPLDPVVAAEVERLAAVDMRDLLVGYRKVEAARRLLPGSTKMGDAELVNGLVKIEQALIEKRKAIAAGALHDLKVQARYLETRHGGDGIN